MQNVKLRGPGPYMAVPATADPKWIWYVAGPDGRLNILTFSDKPGAVFTDSASAKAIADYFSS